MCHIPKRQDSTRLEARWDMVMRRGPITFSWFLTWDSHKSYLPLLYVLQCSAKSFTICVWAALFQDGSLHHSSDSCHSLIGNIGFTSEFGGVNQWGPKWKHNRAIKDLSSKTSRVLSWNQILLQRPTMFTMWRSVHILLFVKASMGK